MQSNQSSWKLLGPINELCKHNRKCASKLQRFLPKQIWTKAERDEVLNALSDLFLLGGDCVVDLCIWLGPLILEIVSRLTQSVLREGHSGQRLLKKMAVVMCEGFPISSVLQRFAVDFVHLYKPFTLKDTSDSDEPPRKRAKKNQISDLDWCHAMWSYMVYLPETADKLGIERLDDFLSSTDGLVRWYASCALSKYYAMSESETAAFLKKYFTPDEQRTFTIRVDKEVLALQERLHKAQGAVEVESVDATQSHTLQTVTSGDLTSHVVSVMGILLPKLGQTSEPDSQIFSPLVLVPSTQQHLRSLAVAVSCCRPVLLQGPVGCGKTSLVEHLAMLTGRHGFPEILKIQLGDQTDSKALLGTYCSTEVAGEFVWRAGVLTQAVSRGSWVLLEDVDTAPMDVLSLLVALAETRTLMVPGHGDEIRAAPGFQLFTTQRLLSSSDGWHHQRGGNSLLLEKLCTVINVEPLSRTELKHVIAVRFPALVPVSDKLLDIYFMLSVGRHDVEELAPQVELQQTRGKFLSTGGRQISTRDLMTWCSRSSVGFDHKESSQGLRVFLEAVDCFVSCIPKQATRLSLACAIGERLNITEDRSKYFCTDYKPSLRDSTNALEIGRVKVQRRSLALSSLTARPAPTFSYTRSSLVLLEKVAVCVNRNEPVLLAGETGTGKTSTVQFLAHYLGHKLHVINLNQQSDSTDLLGGFKPVDLKFVMMPLREEFEMLFCESFSRAQNEKFLSHVQTLFSKKRWNDLLTLIEAPTRKAVNKFDTGTPDNDRWAKLLKRIHELRLQIREMENVLAFSFIEGTLVKALRKGDWILLDEINLATAETLECLSGLLESSSGSVVLTERGDSEPIQRHPDFRLFACMNPATDVGKKDLPVGIRNRFTEFYVEELECPKDLSILVRDYLPGLSLTSKQVTAIVNFYLCIKNDPSDSLMDGTGHRPHFSLRTLCRALMFCARNPCRSVPRSMFEGFCLSFLTQLDRSSHPLVQDLIIKHILANSASKAVLGQKLPKPEGEDGTFVQAADYWISRGTLEPAVPTDYILTPSVRLNLKDLARVVSAGKHAVLLQGETSVGKTSLITYLAQLTGNVCLRVNNHEHTDIQEYVGSYAADEHGKLVFKEGVLVEAMRKGYWIILDELNLAPTDVLEALNRLLDDNQELYIPETQEMVQAHPKFMLFATQNPPGLYGGRKVLSRAFRNRFIELHFDEIPAPELETILHQRCGIPLSYAKKLVAVMLELQMRRRGSGIFSGKHGFMTLRDLFRWAQRYNCPEAGKGEKFYDWDQHLAEHGYMLLAGRVRKPEEEVVIKEVIEKHLKRKLQIDALYTILPQTSAPLAAMLNSVVSQSLPGFQHIVWTHSMRRLAVLIGQAIRFKEPILLVGDTGVGKTTVCQLYAALQGRTLLSINCHMHTESADFLGGLRPVRSQDDDSKKENMLFEWKDGPLVTAMKEGAMFLIDEISLADDSVLERLNSVLEPERTILLAERASGGEAEVEKLQAAEHFQVFATMNPGGDFGKKELSPALRNRFTEIWCPQSHDRADLIAVIEKNIHPGLHLYNTQDGMSGFGHAILEFVEWFLSSEMGRRVTVSIRDILSWVGFINTCAVSQGHPTQDADAMETDDVSQCSLDSVVAYVHGACLVFIDSLGAGSTTFITEANAQASRLVCLSFLQQQLTTLLGHDFDLNQCQILLPGDSEKKMVVVVTEQTLCIPPFHISREPVPDTSVEKFALQAPTTCVNGQRLLRALQLPRPVLLEGSPGVGKTSLVAAIARMARKTLIRINLSEQTDVTDLFGADLPVEGQEGGHFAWRDGPFLQALKAGHWIVFDELNLASQSVLEGLNACFDHRAEVYIPELGKTFHIQHEKTRIFACQNPLSQGGGRKGLPRSFLNRFTQVYVDPLTRSDLLFITTALYPGFPEDMLLTMVDFNSKMQECTMVQRTFGGKGAPWEFNLRDLFRWCDLLQANQCIDNLNPGEYVGLIYKDRMRTAGDKTKVDELYLATFEQKYPLYSSSRKLHIGHSLIQAGHSFLPRGGCEDATDSKKAGKSLSLHHSLEPLESLMKCVEMGWLTILVGPQSSGKTSLVKLLSKLTGRALCVLPMNSSMDTTELLGGFEQSDVWRHLGLITALLQAEVRNLGKRFLLEKDSKESSFLRLVQDWAKYRTLATTTEGLSCLDVMALFSQHLKQLQMILGHLENIGHSLPDKLSEIQHLISQLSTTVSNMKPGGGGGAFEWMDSMLVKALKNGDWLLIDNVNFCSASVLDRLNALLEPKGVLSINERGSVNGEIATVVPHPEFRLFFAMDPRYGEISRAMRNRGIEIYLLGEDEGCAYSQPDICCMMGAAGLNDKRVCQWWLELHTALKSELPFGDRPAVADLLHAGTLCVQLLDRGFSLRHAFAYAAEDSYVGNKRNAAAKQLARNIVSRHLEAVPEHLSDASVACIDVQAAAKPWVGEARHLANVKRDATLILSTLERLSHNPSRTMTPACRVELQTAVLIFTSLQSELSWKLALEWTEAVIPTVEQNLAAVPGTEQDVHNVKFMLVNWKTLVSDCLKQVFAGSTRADLTRTLESVFASSSTALTLLREQPWDLTLNPQASQHAALVHERESGRTLQAKQALALNNVQKLISRLQLIQICVVLAHNLKDKMIVLEETISKGKRKASAIQPLGLVSLLLSHVTEQLPQLLESLEDDHLAYLVEAPYNLLWIVRLADVALTWQSLHRDVFIAHLALHWHWVQDRLRCLLTQAQLHNPKIAMVMGELQRHLGGGDKSVKMHVKFWTTIGHPRPFTSEAEAAVVQSLTQITSALTLCSSDSQVTLKRKVDAFTGSGLSCQGHVQDIMSYIASMELSEAEKAIQVLASFLTRNGLMQACKTAPSTSENETDNLADTVKTVKDSLEGRKTPSQFVSLWPLFGHMSLLAEMSSLSSQSLQHAAVDSVDASRAVLDSGPVEVPEVAPLRDYVISHLPELTNWSLSGRYFLNGNYLGEVQRLLSRLWSSPTCYRHQQWLKWSDHQDELLAPVEDMGPGVLHGAPVCRFAMHILSKNSEITNTVDLLPLHVSLGNLQEQTQEVSLMSRHVWCHSSALASPQYDIRLLEKQLLHQSFMKLMCAMQCLLAPNYQPDWSAALKDLQVTCHFTGQSFGEFQNILSCSLHSFPSHISALLPRCLEVVHDALRETSPDRLVPLVGHGLVYVGLLLAHFLSPKGPIDPVEKNRLKLGHIDKELEELEAELSTWNQHLLLRTGRDISETHTDHLHPRVLAQLQRRDKLKTCRIQLEQCAAYRPDMIQYIQLSQAISSFMESSCSVSKVSDLVRRLNIASHHVDVTLTAALQEERVWQDTTERFIQRLMSTFQCYMDIVVPFCVGVQEMKLGLRLLAQNSHKTLKMRKLGPCQNITSLVGTLCSFPTIKQTLPDLLSLANQMSSSSVQDAAVSVLLSSGAGDDVKEEVRTTKSRLLLCALLLLKAHSFISRRLDGNFIATLSSILDLFTSAWAEQEERRKQKEAEDSALFKYKEQIHGDERSENEKEEADFRAAYPSFDQDFIDVTGAVRLEDVGLQKGHEDPAGSSRMHSLDCISPKEMAQVCSAHSEILITLSQADWLERNPSDCVADVLTPALMSYQIGTTVVRSAFDVLDPEVDGQVLGSHLLVGGSVLQYLELQDGSSVMQDVLKKPSVKSYNIYYDANVPEVMKCKAVIDSLRKRVRELQKEWPDHPTLVLLNQVMDRILSFSVTSPVVKFLTGLELLLQKAQDWEGNAASYVSMASQLSEITSVIVSWRKLELSCWSSALDREEEKCKEKASHWWFHLFQVTSAFVSSDHLPDSKDTDKASVLDSLKKFMETSTMGEYSFRLQMLLAFHCQLLHMNSSPAQKHLVRVLWNIHQFYKQYQPSVEAEIKRLRSPIDKQLKGFVKIARWSDLNYWALKSSTEKTHRTVHKYIREYQAVLRQPAKSMLGDKGDDLVVQAVKQVSGFPLEEQFTLFTQCLTGSLRSAQVDESCMFKLPSAISSDVPLLLRMPSLFKKMKKHLVTCVAETRHAKRIIVFDDFTGELIQEIHELQGLQVDMSAEKDKQKSQAKSFNLMKRKSLADLFKCLSEIGLSYRKGVSGKAGRGFRDALELPPLNLQAHPELPVSKLWSGCETYFYRCISRYAQFSAAVVSPSKELTMADIERIRGFIEHFCQLYIEQRDRLSSLTSSFLSLNKMLMSVRSLEKSSSCSIPPQSESQSWLAQTKQLTTQLSEGMLQFQLLLESCPSDHQELSLVNVHPSPLPSSRLPPSALWSRGDSAWTQCYETLQMMIKSVRDEQTVIDKLLNESILARSDLETVAKVLDAYKCLTSQLAEVSSHFTQNSPGDKCCLVSTFSYLCSEISCLHEGFHLWYNKIQARTRVASSEVAADGSMQDSPSAISDEFLSKTESFVEALLLGVQNVVKMRQLSVEDAAKDGDAGEKSEDFEDDLKEAHLTKHLLDLEKNVITNLGCDQITAKLEDLICYLCRQSDEVSSSSGQTATSAAESLTVDCQSLLQSVPLASAFSSLVESQLGLSVALHRSMGKLLSVLLAVFTELSQKGFCIPPELSEEMAGEGATEFKDIEGGGLGEGEGAKDVSDQIESEDQLEDARQPGQEDKTEDPQDQPDIPSEDNAIEMSDDFDGKLHNKDGTEKEEDNEKDANEDEDMEKQMGEADGEQNDRLDERMWGSDEEEEDENGQDEKDTKEDQGGGGMDKQKEEMVAKDDNKSASEAPDDTEDDAQKDTEEKQQQNELMEDNDDYDDNQVNPHNKEDKEEDAENLDLPTDLNLDDGEKNDKDADDDDNDVENKDDDEEKKNSDETQEEESEASKEESTEEVEDVQANKLEPQDLENNEDKSGEDNLQNMTAEKEEEEKEGEGDEGTSGQEEEKPTAELGRDEDDATTSEDKVDTTDDAGDVAQHTEAADSLGRGLEQDNTQQEEATRDKQDKAEEKENVGAASSEDQEGHQGQQSSQTSDASASQKQQVQQRNPGQSDNERSLGSHDREHRRLKTQEESRNRNTEEQDTQDEDERRQTAKEYEHIKDAKSHYDAQTIDVASKEQMLDKQAVPSQVENEGDELEDEDDVRMDVEEEEMEATKHSEKKPAKSKDQDKKVSSEEDAEPAAQEQQKMDVEGERVLTLTADRPPESSVHTLIENLHMDVMPHEMDLDVLRTQLEQCVRTWSHPEDASLDVTHVALEAWQKYQAITGALSQELCEQLRLILEPSQATKLKGDYRTGKRLNMRKVIPYIASQFRKDKIWLRRSKPSKRQYQIMMAIDDSASMADNHSKQLAFESLALVSNALTLLESGELSVCSFGEEVRLLHPFAEPFSNQSGAKILQQLSCEQTQTKYGMLLDKTLAMFVEARSRLSAMAGDAETAQLLLVLSDGNGVFREGMDVVRRAVRRARAAKIFLVFIILDNPERKSSILDSRVPIMEPSGQIREIKSYLEMFPFPFYILLRDINSMPQILSDALRQWFELVTSSDR